MGVTGHVLEKFKKEGIRAGMDEVLDKPLYNHVLKSALIKYQLIQ